MINNPLRSASRPKHRHFVEAYIQTQGNAPEAPPRVMAHRNLRDPNSLGLSGT